MYFDARITVTIYSQTTGEAQVVQTVHSVHVKNDSKEIGSSCDIMVPLNCRINYAAAPNTFLTKNVKVLFSSGDKVTVTARYQGMPDIQVFAGFIYEFMEGTPMKLRCLDNIYLLNQTTVNLSYQSVTLRNLINKILTGTGVTLVEPTIDLTLQNITFRLMSPASILEWFKKELGLNISLTGNNLYCNIASNTVNIATLNTGRNVITSNLQKPEALYLKLKVKAWFIQENGKKTSLEVGDTNGELREVFFYKIPYNVAKYTQLAQQALIKYKQMKFSGDVETYLYPDMGLFWKVQYTDLRYPDRNGNYTVVGMNFEINEKGYHRKIKLAYLSDIDSSVDALASNTVNMTP